MLRACYWCACAHPPKSNSINHSFFPLEPKTKPSRFFIEQWHLSSGGTDSPGSPLSSPESSRKVRFWCCGLTLTKHTVWRFLLSTKIPNPKSFNCLQSSFILLLFQFVTRNCCWAASLTAGHCFIVYPHSLHFCLN